MCGLAAMFSSRPEASVDDVGKMLNTAVHRGPDGSGVTAITDPHDEFTAPRNAWAVLGHVRLSVVDVSSNSAQPMSSPCNRFLLVFNGEIYNHHELRDELEQQGIRFRTEGDTEVLLQSLMRWGADALPRLRGMFALVFIDRLKNTSLVARDRYGIKPLYFWRAGYQLYFASEIKQFTVLPKWRALLEKSNAIDFLTFGLTDHNTKTLFRDVHHVPAGCVIQIDRSTVPGFQLSKWWNPERAPFVGSYQQAIEILREKFRESLQLHLRADVAIASCLSGGLDSSAIVCSAMKWFSKSTHSLNTFTAVSSDSRIDESHFAHLTNQFAGTSGIEVSPTPAKLLSDIGVLTWHQDEPFSSTSIFAQWCVFEQIKLHGFKVALDGQGADEPFAGYDSFIALKLVRHLEQGDVTGAIGTWRLFRQVKRLRMSNVLSIAAYRYTPSFLIPHVGKLSLLGPFEIQKWLSPEYSNRPFRDSLLLRKGSCPSLRAASRNMVDKTNLPQLLRFEDRNSMAFGVEARVPFVDHELMEFALTLPEDYLLRNGETKAVLRRALDGILPAQVMNRKDKIGFQTSESSWMQTLAPALLQPISRELDQVTGVLSESGQRAIRDIERADIKVFPPWRLISFLWWMRTFQVAIEN